jgi:hypothetical protein
MATYTTVGNCPKCGAPIYVPTVWHGILPPPNMYSCGCFPSARTMTETHTKTNPYFKGFKCKEFFNTDKIECRNLTNF